MFKPETVHWLRREVQRGELSRAALGRGLCEQDGWRNRQGQLCAASARKALPALVAELGLQLPAAQPGPPRGRGPAAAGAAEPQTEFEGSLTALGAVRLSLARTPQQRQRCARLLQQDHPLGAGRAPGRRLVYLVESERGALGVLSFVAAPLRLGPRDQHLGWDERTCGADIERIVCNDRFLVRRGVKVPNLASHVLGQAARRLAEHRPQAKILLVDAETGAMVPRAVRPSGAYSSVSEFASSTVVSQAMEARDVFIVHDVRLDPRLQHAASVLVAGVRSVICVPLLGRSGPIGALYADKLGLEQFAPDLAEYAAAFAGHAAAALETAQLYDDRERHFRATLEAFAKAIDARDPYTAGHSARVTTYTLVLARQSGKYAADVETLRRGGLLHDIGKVGVPDAVFVEAG